MTRKGNRVPYNKDDLAWLKKNAVINAKPQPTKPSATHSSKDQYTSAKTSSVPTERTPGDIIIDFLQQWANWLAWIGFFAAGIVAYSNFNNDISNTISDVTDLKEDTKQNRNKLITLEKTTFKNDLNIGHNTKEINSIKNDAVQIKNKIQRLELNQAQQSAIKDKNFK